MKKIIFTILVILSGVCPVRADLVFDSGYNTFDANDSYYGEVWVINDAVLDVLGGTIGKLETTNYATANIYDGDILYALYAMDNSTVNIHGGLFDIFGAWNNSLAYLYAYDVTYHPTGGITGEGWIEGKYYSNDKQFSFSFYHDTSYSHLIVVSRPVLLVETDIHPNTLNLKSKGKWITCQIWLPEDCNAADIDPQSIRLEHQIQPQWLWFDDERQVVMAKFRRSQLDSFLEPGEIDLIVSCHLIDGTYFEGTDTIRIISQRPPRRGK